ncbi:hypothetical protein NDU88_004786 [Pleurodeles waltl]|uniref:Uncharacterized protein n=1 Tax=Pleurodeles waltl TaxID=8319 RepID=A0AAV7L2E4_PLEWA|nr:hypothetical protein NDU88_004786 [Pleurodeles waltl]
MLDDLRLGKIRNRCVRIRRDIKRNRTDPLGSARQVSHRDLSNNGGSTDHTPSRLESKKHSYAEGGAIAPEYACCSKEGGRAKHGSREKKGAAGGERDGA